MNASLVAEDTAIQPGRPFVVALQVDHESPWHTYWLNPGIGEATSIGWTLPNGWQASGIDWPTPVTIHDMNDTITGHGYTGRIYLPVTITPPAGATAGRSVRLAASVKWLMCTTEKCVPGGAQVHLTLPVSPDPPLPNTNVRAELARMPMPKKPLAGWTLEASRTAEHIALRIDGSGGLRSAHFFSATELIAPDGDQEWEKRGETLILTLEVDPYFEGEQDKLLGVLAYMDASGAYTGIQIAVPFSEAKTPDA